MQGDAAGFDPHAIYAQSLPWVMQRDCIGRADEGRRLHLVSMHEKHCSSEKWEWTSRALRLTSSW